MSHRITAMLTRVVAPLLAVAWLCGGVGALQFAEEGGREISLRTVYLTEPVGHWHGIAIAGQAPGDAKVSLDPNVCGINTFGDRTVCTLIAMLTVDVEVVQLRLADESGQGRAIYELKGKLLPQDSRWFLVGPPRGQTHYRLVVQTGKDKRRPITLEPKPRPKPKLKLCEKGSFRAEQAGGKVTIYAKGSHNTGGYKVWFEQLPIEIFPPQFRLVCLAPSGVVTQAVTPFEASISFGAKDPIESVIVHDENGRHKVPVKH